MPRSRSSSLLSIARSTTRSLARKTPLWCKSASTMVVFPWSTWAIIATLRRKGLAISDEDISPVYQPARLPSLDGWRAVAIALVVLSHFTAVRGPAPPAWWPQVFQGNLGVRIFFVISGLLITYLLLVEADRRGRPSLRAFYTRRWSLPLFSLPL